jgi:gamma-glutamylcyclotransferase (GGCT)/AIG2-like uncharacterized protein YtfP
MNLFAYGSLILPEVWEAVTGHSPPSEPGTIHSFIRRTVAGATFPGILPTGERSQTVDGSIYREIDAGTLEALNEFESDFYIRQPVIAVNAQGEEVQCEAYVVPPSGADLLSDEKWSLETFSREHLDGFLGRNFS